MSTQADEMKWKFHSANSCSSRGEQFDLNEMRTSFIGSTPIPVTKQWGAASQAARRALGAGG